MPNKISDQCKNCMEWDCAWCEIYIKYKEGSRQEERNDRTADRLKDIAYFFERERNKAIHQQRLQEAELYSKYINAIKEAIIALRSPE